MHKLPGMFKKANDIFWWKLLASIRLPVDTRKVVISSYNTRGYSDSARAIADELIAQRTDVRILAISNSSIGIPPAVGLIKPFSLASVYHMVTAGVWIDTMRKRPHVKKRKSQLYIQAWHGFPFKKIERDAEKKLTSRYIKAAKNDSSMCDMMISNSLFLTNIYKNSFWYQGKIMTCGFPRNDILIKDSSSEKAKIRSIIGVSDSKKIILYAPTFRRSETLDVYDIKPRETLEMLKHRFGGDWVMLLRLHPNIAHKSSLLAESSPDIIDVSTYHDSQDLLLISDVLITDYSSIMFDFGLTGRPAFLYALDIENYKLDRGFYYDIHETPFQVADSSEALLRSISNFNMTEHKARIREFTKRFGIIDNKLASPVVVDYIKRWIDEHEK